MTGAERPEGLAGRGIKLTKTGEKVRGHLMDKMRMVINVFDIVGMDKEADCDKGNIAV